MNDSVNDSAFSQPPAAPPANSRDSSYLDAGSAAVVAMFTAPPVSPNFWEEGAYSPWSGQDFSSLPHFSRWAYILTTVLDFYPPFSFLTSLVMTVNVHQSLLRIPIIPLPSFHDPVLQPATLSRLIIEHSGVNPHEFSVREQYRPGHWEVAAVPEYTGPYDCGAQDVSIGGNWIGQLLNFVPIEKGRSGVLSLVEKRDSTLFWDTANASGAYLKRREAYLSGRLAVKRFVHQLTSQDLRRLDGFREGTITGLRVSPLHVPPEIYFPVSTEILYSFQFCQ